MLNALFWGLVATSSLVLGGILGSWLTIGKRTLGVIMAFGAGVLLSAVAYEMVFESLALAKGTGAPTIGMFVGALTFFFADKLIAKLGSRGSKSGNADPQAALIVPMALAIVLDGVPESALIGLGLLETGSVSLALLVAVFISNLPEAIAGTTGMRAAGWSRAKVLLFWSIIAVICALATVAGFSLFAGASNSWLAFVGAFSAGAILTMLANSMMPEAFERGGKLAGLFTVLGFTVSVAIILFERS